MWLSKCLKARQKYRERELRCWPSSGLTSSFNEGPNNLQWRYTRKGWVAFKRNAVNSSWHQCQQGEHWEDLHKKMNGCKSAWLASGGQAVVQELDGKEFIQMNYGRITDRFIGNLTIKMLIYYMCPVINQWHVWLWFYSMLTFGIFAIYVMLIYFKQV